MPPTSVDIRVEPARESDVSLLRTLISALADYEKLTDLVVVTEADLREALFGARPAVEAAIAYAGTAPAGYAMWFTTFSSFLGKRGLYLEDVFVLPEWRGKGLGRALLAHLAQVGVERACGRIEWSVLDWNAPSIGFYEAIGARPNAGWTTYRLTGESIERLAASRRSG